MSFNLPNPCLLGILLVISTHNGPQLVFKYPANLNDKPETELDDDEYKVYDSSDEDSIDADEQWDTRHYNYYSGTKKDLLSFLDDQEMYRTGQFLHKKKPSIDSETTSSLRKTLSGKSEVSSHSKTSIRDRTDIYGIEQDYLIEMLCPPREMCNSRFEINIDDYIFIGLPIHCQDHGWKRRKDDEPQPEISMNMFHLVFLMKPPVLESNYRIDELYHYVSSRLSLVLRHEQQKYDYIWQQVLVITQLKEEFAKLGMDNLTNYLIEKSSLCKLMADCFNYISRSEIANLFINNKLRSFQIPVKTEFHSIPESTVPYLPGSHLSSTVTMVAKTGLINVGETTRYGMTNTMSMMLNNLQNDTENGVSDQEDDTNVTADDIIYLALLLLDNPETIIKDIRAEPDSVLANFIRMIKPTESLIKLHNKISSSSEGNLELSQIKSFAFHLIYWRRARVIHPLNTRSIYIVSPMAPITLNMYNDIPKFKHHYPTMPSLPQFLKLLSSSSKKPRQFLSLIPSRDHKDIYLSALGWLIRHGYVTQLRTYIWLKVSKKIKTKVEEEMENETTPKLRSKKSTIQGTDNTSKSTDNKREKTGKSVESKSSWDRDIDDIDDIANGLKSTNLEVILEEDDDTIILDPGRASTLERKWIHKIVSEECNLSPELTVIFYNILKFMNGKTSLELLLLRENISRNDFRRLLLQIEDHIISVRHW